MKNCERHETRNSNSVNRSSNQLQNEAEDEKTTRAAGNTGRTVPPTSNAACLGLNDRFTSPFLGSQQSAIEQIHMDQDDKAHYIIKDLVSSWRHVRFLSNFIVCPVEEKYKCTYYKCQPDGTMKPIKTVVRTDLIFDEDELRNAEDRKNTLESECSSSEDSADVQTDCKPPIVPGLPHQKPRIRPPVPKQELKQIAAERLECQERRSTDRDSGQKIKSSRPVAKTNVSNAAEKTKAVAPEEPTKPTAKPAIPSYPPKSQNQQQEKPQTLELAKVPASSKGQLNTKISTEVKAKAAPVDPPPSNKVNSRAIGKLPQISSKSVPLVERKSPKLNLDERLKVSPQPKKPQPIAGVQKRNDEDAERQAKLRRVETEFLRIKSNHVPLVCLFGLSHPAISKEKNDLLQTIANHFNFVILDLDEIIGQWKDQIMNPNKSHTIPELAHELAHAVIEKSGYKNDKLLTEYELCQIVKYALVSFHKKGKNEYKGFILDSFPVNPTETELLERIVYPITVGLYMHPTHHEKDVELPSNFRRNIAYSEKLCREVASHHGKRVVEILHPAKLNHQMVSEDLVPLIKHILDEHAQDAKEGRISTPKKLGSLTAKNNNPGGSDYGSSSSYSSTSGSGTGGSSDDPKIVDKKLKGHATVAVAEAK